VRAVTERVTRLLSRSGEAEDAVQDAFADAFAHLPELSDRGRFGSWLMCIAVHQAHRRFRRRRLLARLGIERRLDDALAQLPVALRLVWMLRYVEGCELVEVAEQCGRSLSTIKRQIQRADARLHAHLDTTRSRARTSDG
jgi:RNA polymerase sigma-70 factor (ECF subfamily)